jgi:hypothetical protein
MIWKRTGGVWSVRYKSLPLRTSSSLSPTLYFIPKTGVVNPYAFELFRKAYRSFKNHIRYIACLFLFQNAVALLHRLEIRSSFFLTLKHTE